ncbi:putative sulfate exporter family transporter [Cupriavidus basilensis]
MSTHSSTAVASLGAQPPSWPTRILTLVPLGFIAWLAMVFSAHPAFSHLGLSALTLAMFAGMVAGNTLPQRWLTPLGPGMQLARQQLLRPGVALYGLRLTFGAIATPTLALPACWCLWPCMVSTMLLGVWIGSSLLGRPAGKRSWSAQAARSVEPAAAIAVASVVRTDDRRIGCRRGHSWCCLATAGMLLYPYLFELPRSTGTSQSVSARSVSILAPPCTRWLR